MNLALQSWSPRTHPLRYDSLSSDSGCSDLSGGTRVYQSLPFARICILDHDPASPIFNKPENASYTVGPFHSGDPHPWATIWAAWVASAGIRVAKIPLVIPPANATGSPSSLYPSTVTKKLSLGFTSKGEIAIAIQKTATSIEVKWFRDNTGASIGTADFVGKSPALFNNGELYFSDDENETDLVLYYLRPETPRTIFARFERDDFATEYIINQDLPTSLAGLTSSGMNGLQQALYARDVFGRDITLYSEDYIGFLDGDKIQLSVSVVSGRYAATAIPTSLPTERITLSVAIESGTYSNPVKEPTPSVLSGDKNTLSIGIESGTYL